MRDLIPGFSVLILLALGGPAGMAHAQSECMGENCETAQDEAVVECKGQDCALPGQTAPVEECGGQDCKPVPADQN